MRSTPALLSAALMLLLLPGTLTRMERSGSVSVPVDVVVRNSLLNEPPMVFSSGTVYRGILLGALNRLMAANGNFTFTYTQDPNYGPSLDSVNGLSKNDTERTYWELLVRTQSGEVVRPDVGIGCYIPSANETIILNFTTW